MRTHIFHYKNVTYSVKSNCPFVVFPALINKAERFVMQTEKQVASLLSDGVERKIVIAVSVNKHRFSALITANCKGI